MTRLSFGVSDDVNTEEVLSEYAHREILAESGAEATEEVENGTVVASPRGSSSEKEGFHLFHEASLLLNIALPSVAVQLSVLFVFPQTASSVGRTFGTKELAGFSLGSLVGNLTCMSVMVGALTAADTLMPRAYGIGRYPEVGRLAIRGFVMCFILLMIPIIPLCTIMECIFDALGQDPYASRLASKWIRVYLMGVPAMLLFRVIQSFLNAQHKVWPLVVGSMTSCFLVHPVLLKIFLPEFGFLGSSAAICITQYVIVTIVLVCLIYNPIYKLETWPGFSKRYLKEALQCGPVLQFLSLSLGGVLSLSEWWFWETVCFIVGSFGVVPLCIHTIAYNLVPLLFMIPLGISIGLTVRMGSVIATDVNKAKRLAIWCMVFTTVVGAAASLLVFHFRSVITTQFTDDPEVIEGCKAIWPKLCYYIFVLYIFGINSAILRALGMQWRMAAIIFACLWLGTLPAIVQISIRKQGGLDTVWSILPCFYTLMQILLGASYLTVDWHDISKEIREKERRHMELEKHTAAEKHLPYPTEESPLVGEK